MNKECLSDVRGPLIPKGYYLTKWDAFGVNVFDWPIDFDKSHHWK